jgi:hypothetical protein
MSCSHPSSSYVQGVAGELHSHGHKLQGNCLLLLIKWICIDWKKKQRRRGSLDLTNYMGPWFMNHHTNVEHLEFLSTYLLELVITIHGILGMNDEGN